MDAWRKTDCEPIWTRFEQQFDFRPSTKKWPGFFEPRESVTYHIGHVYEEADQYQKLTMDLSRKLVSALRRCVNPSDFVYVLDWQHQTFRFWPHAHFEYEDEDDWPTPALPNGDYYIFLAEDLTFGVLGHPWEQTMCVFGDPLLSAFKRDMPVLFDRPVRRGGNVV